MSLEHPVLPQIRNGKKEDKKGRKQGRPTIMECVKGTQGPTKEAPMSKSGKI